MSGTVNNNKGAEKTPGRSNSTPGLKVFVILAAVLLGALLVATVTDVSADDPDYSIDITEQPKNVHTYFDEQAVFIVSTHQSNLTYQWEYNDGSGWSDVPEAYSIGSKTDILVVSTTYFGDSTEFRCQIGNGPVSTTTDTAYLYVYPDSVNIHYISDPTHMNFIGDEQVHAGLTPDDNKPWNMDDVYIQTADIDFDSAELNRGWQARVSYVVETDKVVFTHEYRYSETDTWKLWTSSYGSGFFGESGSSLSNSGVPAGASFYTNHTASKYDGSPTPFLIFSSSLTPPGLPAAQSSQTGYALSMTVSGDTGSTGSVTSYWNGSMEKIGTNTNPFKGTFEGNGFKIIGMSIISKNYDYVGMFGVISDAKILNVAREGGMTASTYSGSFTGGIAGSASGSIIRGCYNSGPVTSDTYTTGGIVGLITTKASILDQCYNTGYVFSRQGTTGGIVGSIAASAPGSIISNSYNLGPVKTGQSANSGRSAGGIVDSVGSSTLVTGCYNIGAIWAGGGSPVMGGIVATGSGGMTIENCYNTGRITTVNQGGHIGGIIGSTVNEMVNINDCYSIGTFYLAGGSSYTTYLGGIVGSSSYNSVTSSFYLDGCVNINKNPENVLLIGEESAKTELRMKDILTYSTWNQEIWSIVPNEYPTLEKVPGVLTVTMHPLDVQVKEGDSARLSVKAEGNSPLKYQWQKYNETLEEWENLVGEYGSILYLDSVDAVDAGDYRCEVAYGVAKVYSNAATLTTTDRMGTVTVTTITLGSSSEGGLVSPGSINVPYFDGSSETVKFTIKPLTGFEIAGVRLNGVSIPSGELIPLGDGSFEYKLTVDSEVQYELEVSFGHLKEMHEINVQWDSEKGDVLPGETFEAYPGDVVTFEVVPGLGWKVGSVSYKHGIVTMDPSDPNKFWITCGSADSDVIVEFVVDTTQKFKLMTIIEKGDEISTGTSSNYSLGDVVDLNPTIPEGWFISSVTYSGGVVNEADGKYWITTVGSPMEVRFVLEKSTEEYNVDIVEGAYGTITPNSGVKMTFGETKTFTVMPEPGFKLGKVTYSGNTSPVIAADGLSFTITLSEIGDKVLDVEFVHDTVTKYPVTMTHEGNGKDFVTLTPETIESLYFGEVVKLYISSVRGVSNTVTLNGASLTVTSGYCTFTAIAGAMDIVVTSMVNTQTSLVYSQSESLEKGTLLDSGNAGFLYYKINDPLKFEAVPKEGYKFVEWRLNGEFFSSEAKPATPFDPRVHVGLFIAYFEVDDSFEYTIGAASDDVLMGSVSGGGSFTVGSDVRLVATPVDGYRFIGWANSQGESVSANAVFDFKAHGNDTYTAYFELEEYYIRVYSNTTVGGTVSGGGYTFKVGDALSLVATPSAGYTFVDWTKDGNTITAPATFAFGDQGDYVAIFNIAQVTVEVSSDPAEGTAEVDGGASSTVDVDDEVVLIATPEDGYEFVGWMFNNVIVSTDATYRFNAEIGKEGVYTAVFKKTEYTVTVSADPSGGGKVSVSKGKAVVGDALEFKAEANEGYSFDKWTKGGVNTPYAATFTIDPFTSTDAGEYVAIFTPDPAHEFTVNAAAEPVAGGSAVFSVTGGGPVVLGAEVTLTATANGEYEFIKWTKDGQFISSDAEYIIASFDAEDAGNYVANFAQMYTITVVSGGNGSVSGTGTYKVGDTVALTADADDGYVLAKWTFGANAVYIGSETFKFTFTAADEGEYTATFVVDQTQTFSLNVDATIGGSVTGGGMYYIGQEVTLVASADAGYEFVEWTVDGAYRSGLSTYTFNFILGVDNIHDFIANFEVNESDTRTISTSVKGSGSLSGAGEYFVGKTVTLTATPDPGYKIVKWMKDNKNLTFTGDEMTFPFEMGKEGLYTVVFEVDTTKTFEITTVVSPSDAGTAMGGEFYVGQEAILSATANPGYKFQKWTRGGVDVSTSNPWKFTMAAADEGEYTAVFEVDQSYTFDVSVSVDPAGSGTVTGGKGYYIGEPMELTAVASDGYKFINWMKNGAVVSTIATWTPNFAVGMEGEYVANFEVDQSRKFPITVGVKDAGTGTVSGAGSYYIGQSVILTATPTDGYKFVGWEKGGVTVSTTNPWTFSMIAADEGEYKAVFIIDQNQKFHVGVSSTAGGSATGSGNYYLGQPVVLTATPADGYKFIEWTFNGAFKSSDTTLNFTMAADKIGEYVANFEVNEGIKFQITTAVETANTGTVSGAGDYFVGQQVTLTATPSTGYKFTGWNVNGSVVNTTNPWIFSMTVDAACEYVAIFVVDESQKFHIGVSYTSGGSATGAGNYYIGQEVILTATAADGYKFVNWTKSGTAVGTNAVLEFDLSADNIGEYVANFTVNADRKFTVDVEVKTAGTGTVFGGDEYLIDDNVVLTANPASGYRFVGWEKGGVTVSTNNPWIFSMTASDAGTYTAVFEVGTDQKFNIGVSSTVGGSATGSGNYSVGDEVTLTAIPLPGYKFAGWTKDAVTVSDDLVMSFTFATDKAGEYVANFEVDATDTFVLSIVVNTPGTGTVSGAGSYHIGQNVEMTATPASGYRFVGWMKGGSQVSTTNPWLFSFSAPDAGEYTAVFSIDENQKFHIGVSSTSGGSATGSGNYYLGQSVTMSAIADPGYVFTGWYKDDILVHEGSVWTFDFTSEMKGEYVAMFGIHKGSSWDVSVSVETSGTGTVSGAGTFSIGDTVTLTANPASGYRFVGWEKDGAIVSMANPWIFSMVASAAGEYVAVFDIDENQKFHVGVSSTAGGSVTGAGNYYLGQSVALKATPNANHVFVNWTMNGAVVSTDATFIFDLTSEMIGEYVANFASDLEITVTAGKGGSASGGGNFSPGQSVTLVATPYDGYAFVNWTKNGKVVSTDSTWNFTFAAGDEGVYVANFEVDPMKKFEIIASSSTGGSANGGGEFTVGTEVTLVAIPDAGYRFVNWTKNGKVVSTDSTWSFSITADAAGEYVANFAQEYEISVSAGAGGSATGGKSYVVGQSVTLVASPDTGYRFVNWTKNGVEVSTDSTWTFDFSTSDEGEYVANFIKTFRVLVSLDSGVKMTPGSTVYVDIGGSVTFTFSAKDGSKLVRVLIDGVEDASALERGTVTFYNVTGNHKIQVVSSTPGILSDMHVAIILLVAISLVALIAALVHRRQTNLKKRA